MQLGNILFGMKLDLILALNEYMKTGLEVRVKCTIVCFRTSYLGVQQSGPKYILLMI